MPLAKFGTCDLIREPHQMCGLGWTFQYHLSVADDRDGYMVHNYPDGWENAIKNKMIADLMWRAEEAEQNQRLAEYGKLYAETALKLSKTSAEQYLAGLKFANVALSAVESHPHAGDSVKEIARAATAQLAKLL
jgi:hypothetical protein